MNVDALIRDQTPVVALVTLLDGTLRQRAGIVTSFDGQTLRIWDVNANPVDGAPKGFRSTPATHVVRLEPIPATHPAHRIVRQAVAAAYQEVPQ